MVLVPYVGKYFGRKVAYWGESITTSTTTAPAAAMNTIEFGLEGRRGGGVEREMDKDDLSSTASERGEREANVSHARTKQAGRNT